MIITTVWNNSSANASTAAQYTTGSFTTSGGYIQLLFAASGYSTAANARIGANLLIDGNVVTASTVFVNPASCHQAFVPSSLVMAIPAGVHNVAITPLNGNTVIDLNDYLTLVVTELSFT